MTKKKDFRVRRSLLAGAGLATAAFVSTQSTAEDESVKFQAAQHGSDAWMDEIPGTHRVWIDTSYAIGGMEALHYAKNILSSNVTVDGGQDSDYAMVICWRHYSPPLAYNDSVWEKYGEIFCSVMQLKDPKSGHSFLVNPGNIPGRSDLDNAGDTIDLMLQRGVNIAVCNSATTWYAGYVADQIGGNAEEIYQEFVDSAVPNSRFVEAGVFATTRAQEYGYSLLYAG